MKILFLNMLPDAAVFGHKKVDKKLIDALNNFSKVNVIAPHNWFEKLSTDIVLKEIKSKDGKRKISYYYTCLKNLLEAYRMDRKEKFDYIVFATFDEYMSCIAMKLFRDADSRLFITYRNNLDEIDRLIKKRNAFRSYCKKINHIVFEEFQREHLISEYKIPADKVYTIPYPKRDRVAEEPIIYDFLAISNTNDEEWIDKLIEIEERSEIIKKNGLQVVFRSKKRTYDNGFLHVIKGFIENSEYNHYLGASSTVFIPYPSTFRYRMSGVMIEAFSNHKRVIGSNIPLLNAYKERYPRICKTVNTFDELLCEIVNKEKGSNLDDSDFVQFEEDHSIEALICTFKKIFVIK